VIFASFEFLFLFLPLFLVVYYLTPAGLRNWPILLFSWAFYAWWRVDFLALLVCVTLGTYAVSRWMSAAGQGTTAARRWLVLGLVANLGVLGWFKYANFGVASFNQSLGLIGRSPTSWSAPAWSAIVLPVGLSFYVLQSVSYLIDVSRGTIAVSRSLLNYAAYKAMFSQLIAGPIVRYAQIANELKCRRHSLSQFGAGARRFMSGFAMKVIVADSLAPLVDAVFALSRPTLADSWLGAVAYTLQLFFDFAGYSAMAIGLALMIGFHFPENFRNPYLARSIPAFWNTWHITLSSFLRDYLYIPLGGNRRGAAGTYRNLLLTMMIGGAWHGANWTFVVWGVWQGLLLIAARAYAARGGPHLPYPLANALTMLAVVLGWVVFRAPDLGHAAVFYAGMLGLQGGGISDPLAWQITPDRLWMVPIGIVAVYLPLALPRLRAWAAAGQHVPRLLHNCGIACAVAGPFCGFLAGMILLYSRDAVPFLYFQF
jgi:alginate O-acetyltransferase complex protein AlgI